MLPSNPSPQDSGHTAEEEQKECRGNGHGGHRGIKALKVNRTDAQVNSGTEAHARDLRGPAADGVLELTGDVDTRLTPKLEVVSS